MASAGQGDLPPTLVLVDLGSATIVNNAAKLNNLSGAPENHFGDRAFKWLTLAMALTIFVLVALILFIQTRPRGLFPQAGRAGEDK